MEETTTRQSEMRLEKELYPKTEKCRLLSSTTPAVAADQEGVAQTATETRAGATPRRQSSGIEWDMVRVVDGVSVESGAQRLVRSM